MTSTAKCTDWNWETGNIAEWIGNDEFIYLHARKNRRLGYKKWAARYRDETGEFQTPDGVDWIGPDVNYDQLDDLIADL